MATLDLTEPARPARTPARSAGRSRLAPRWRKLLLSAHVVTSVGLLGADTAVLALCVAGAGGTDPITVYPAAHLVGARLLVPLAALSLVTGVGLGVLTPWGLVRHPWVTIKLGLNAAGLVLAATVLVPGLAGAADVAAAGDAGVPGALGLVRDSAAACVVLVLAVALSVYKPFGRRRTRRPAATG